jgi:lipopolysaccharide heptosyltransferase II
MVEKDWGNVKKILCIRLDALGDVLMSTPAIRAIKESLPDCRITLLTSPSGARVAPLIPLVDESIAYESPWMKASRLRQDNHPDFAMISRLQEGEFDAAIIFTVFSQNPLPAAFLAYLAGIPLRLAYCRENPYQLLTHWVRETEPQAGIRHEVARQLDLVATVGFKTLEQGLSLQVPEAADRSVESLLRDMELSTGKPWVVIHPGATAPSRRFRPDGFAEVARTLYLDFGIWTIFTGVRKERSLVEGIQEIMAVPSHNLAGELSLAEMAALLKAAPLLISNNSGPVHIAAAVGTPVVDLYALTNPQHTPWNVPHRVLNRDVPCKYCFKSICPEKHHHCLDLVTADEVVEAALDLLEASEVVVPSLQERRL